MVRPGDGDESFRPNGLLSVVLCVDDTSNSSALHLCDTLGFGEGPCITTSASLSKTGPAVVIDSADSFSRGGNHLR